MKDDSPVQNPFGQLLVALVTPFTADGEVDWPGVEKHIDDVISLGADGVGVGHGVRSPYGCWLLTDTTSPVM